MQHKILIAEDDTDISRLLSRILEAQGYQALQAFSGREALSLIEREEPDLLLLDLMLPGLSGEELLRKLREERRYSFPVLILSAKSALGDKVALLKSGADDYITKPFEPEEVIARIQAALRRAGSTGSLSGQQPDALTYGNIKLYPDSRRVLVNDRELSLTAHEYQLLHLFLQSPGKVYSRESLYELVWEGGYYGENNTVNVHVSNLRRKIREADASREYIRTVYGIGFRLG